MAWNSDYNHESGQSCAFRWFCTKWKQKTFQQENIDRLVELQKIAICIQSQSIAAEPSLPIVKEDIYLEPPILGVFGGHKLLNVSENGI